MLDHLLRWFPGARASRRDKAVMAKVETLGAVLRRPATDPAAMERAIQQIIQAGRTENEVGANAPSASPLFPGRTPGRPNPAGNTGLTQASPP
jgi:hypothetical protein